MGANKNNKSRSKSPNVYSDKQYVQISKKHLYWALFAVIAGIFYIAYKERHYVMGRVCQNYCAASGNTRSHSYPQSEKVSEAHKMKDPQGDTSYYEAYIGPEPHPDPNVRNLPSDLSNWPPGEMGLGVTLITSRMKSSEVAKRASMYKNHAFEEYISEMISLDRTLPDFRGQWCRDQYDHDTATLPKTSVIICFHNEAWSTLLRSVHSVVNRTPRHLLKEILLVDDKSTMDHLGTPLDEYVEKKFPGIVKVIRQEKRQGLMRSRMAGIRASTAEVLVFLDSHIEAGIGWLEPLLFRVRDDPKVIISPVIDAINDTTLFYQFIEKDLYGLMNWRLEFEWHELDPADIQKKPDLWAPYDNPIMAGGLFAITKSFFEELGYYDEGMEVWGGENYELSFKAWMCGGRIEIAPCSRVGHIFRSWSPYKIGSEEINHNAIRVAEVWMDEFKYLYYDRLGHFDETLSQRLGNFGDVSQRQELRQKLKCKSFKWFLDSVVAQRLPYHELVGAGELRNPATDLCVDKNDRTEYMDHPVDLLPCHGLAGFQYWWLNKNRYLLRDYMCIGVEKTNGFATVTHCGRSGTWSYDAATKLLRHSLTGKCMAAKQEAGAFRAKAVKCDKSQDDQHWEFTRYKRTGIKYTELV